MTAPLALLNYAGPQPAPRRSLLGRCWRGVVWLITATLLVVFLTLRAVLLIAGFACVVAGLVLLTLGGKRDAARKLMLWRERFVDLCRLWVDDIVRVVRRRGRAPQRVLPVAVSVSSQ